MVINCPPPPLSTVPRRGNIDTRNVRVPCDEEEHKATQNISQNSFYVLKFFLFKIKIVVTLTISYSVNLCLCYLNSARLGKRVYIH